MKIHPEFLPKVYTVSASDLTIDPIGESPNKVLRQVVALAAYKNAIQTYEHFSERREQDGGTRFKGKEYVQDFSYDCWAIDQLSEGIVPMFLPVNDDLYAGVDSSFSFVAGKVLAARQQMGVGPETYPMSGPQTAESRPGWFHPDYTTTPQANLLSGVIPGSSPSRNYVTETGDVAHRNPMLTSDLPEDAAQGVAIDDLTERVSTIEEGLTP